MKKKLNLVLREPVKLHQTAEIVPSLPSPFNEKTEKVIPAKEVEEKRPGKIKPAEVPEKRIKQVPLEPARTSPEPVDMRSKMSPRISQIWEYFCKKASADGDLKNSFVVTRNEVMREAGIGSTNTYRDALRKFQDLGLIKIELRPGVNAGSVFYLTEFGLKQVRLITD